MSYRTARWGSGKETQLAEGTHRKVSAGGFGMLTEQIVESGSRDSKGCRYAGKPKYERDPQHWGRRPEKSADDQVSRK